MMDPRLIGWAGIVFVLVLIGTVSYISRND